MTETLEKTPGRPGAEAGTLRRLEGGGWELRFERRLRHSPERVWKALTTGEGLACWLAEADIELRPGGRMKLAFSHPCDADMPCVDEHQGQNNEVLRVEPFRLFEHTFDNDPASIVRWELSPDGDGTRLALSHRLDGDDDALSMTLSGWHHHLEGLDGAVLGRRHAWSWDRWRSLKATYAAGLEKEG